MRQSTKTRFITTTRGFHAVVLPCRAAAVAQDLEKGRTPSSRTGTFSACSAAAPSAGQLAKAIHVLQVREA
jgi:hypothetical protein